MTPLLLLAAALWAPAALIIGLARWPGEPALAAVERLTLGAALALVLVGWLSLVLAALGLFGGPALCGSLVLCGVLAALWARRGDAAKRRFGGAAADWSRGPASALAERAGALGLVAVLAGAVALYQPPFPYVLGGLDPGVYVNTAAHIVRSGGLVWRDADLAALPPDLRAVLFREEPRRFSFGSRQIGFYIADLDRGLVVPHGLHLYPALMAALWLAGGLDLALRTGALAALVALAAVFCCGRRMGGPIVGLLAAAALAAAIGQSWFARFPAAEPLAQAQVWAGLLALLIALRDGGRALPLLGGMLLGSAHLTKVELVAVPAVLAGLAVWLWLAKVWTPALGWYLGGYAALAGHAALHAALVAPWYATTALGLARLPLWLMAGAPAGLAAGLLALWLGRRPARRLVAWVVARRRSLGLAAAAAVVGLAVWAYAVRPIGSEALPPYEANNRQSLVRLGWYAAPPLVPLAVAGLAVVLVAGEPRALIIAALAIAEAGLHLSDARITPLHLWAGRRLVPVLLPAVALFAALAAARLWPARLRGWPRAALALALIGWIGGYDHSAQAPFVGHVEYAGARGDLAAVAALVPPNGVVLYEWGDESWRLALPLQMQHDVHGFLVPPEALHDERLPALLAHLSAEASAAGLFWLSGGGNLDWLPAGFAAELVATHVLDWPEAERRDDRLPQRIVRYIAVVDLYRLVPRPGAARRLGPTLDVGGDDGCCLVSGFAPPTHVAGCTTCRWAGPAAVLEVPAPAGEGQRELVLALTAGAEQQAPRWVAVWVQGTRLARLPLARGFRTYYIPLPAGLPSAVRVELRAEDAGAFAVDWARVDLMDG